VSTFASDETVTNMFQDLCTLFMHANDFSSISWRSQKQNNTGMFRIRLTQIEKQIKNFKTFRNFWYAIIMSQIKLFEFFIFSQLPFPGFFWVAIFCLTVSVIKK